MNYFFLFSSFSPPSSSLLEEENDNLVAEKGDSDNDSEIRGPVKRQTSRNPFLEDEGHESNSIGEDEKLLQILESTNYSLRPYSEFIKAQWEFICYLKVNLLSHILRFPFHENLAYFSPEICE